MRRTLREVVGFYWESGVGDDVPALAWFLLASLAPLALGVTALTAIVLGDYAEAQALTAKAAAVLPKDAHDQIVQLLLRTKNDSPLLIAGAIVGMVWTSSGAVGVVERCLSRLLELNRANPVLGRLRNIAVAGALSALIVLLVLVASAGTGFAERLGVDIVLIRIAVPIASLAVTLLLSAAAYRALAIKAVSWPAALSGGGVAGVVLLATPTAAGYYLRAVAGRTPVDVFLVLAGVLITCYLVALGLLLGAGLSARVQLGRSPRPMSALRRGDSQTE